MNIAIANQFTKEAIKSRMLQHAANLWGARNPNALDPFVRLLIEAFSTEIYRASNETQNIEGRILDKIATMLTPNLLTIPRPAHGILQAKPVITSSKIHGSTKFTHQKKLAASAVEGKKNDEVQLIFCPVKSTYLVNGQVGFLAAGYQMFTFDPHGFKQPLFRIPEPLSPATCLVGLKLNRKVQNLNDVALYFDFPSYGSDGWIYQLLSLVKVSYNGTPVETTPGIAAGKDEGSLSGQDIFTDYDLMAKIHTEISNQYAHKFITLKDCPVDHKAAAYPELLKELFSESQLQKIPKDVVWLELRFPPNYNYEILSNCYVAINAFPVLNKDLLATTYSYKGLNNILPLRTEHYERFMTVNRVTDASGREYQELPYNASSGGQAGFYSVRHGGVERFDQRSAQDLVSYLLELTRDEVAAFSSLDQTFIRTTLESLARQLRQIHNKSKQIDKFVRQSPSYLVIEPLDAEENIQVEYWVTQAVEANYLRPGTEFRCQNNADVSPQGAILLSETFGGKDQLQTRERVEAYRYALGSRNRLITREDIRNFCKLELGSKLKFVEFRHGVETSPHPRQGYLRTLEIILQPNNYAELKSGEWQTIAENLLIKIRSLSPDGIHYRMKIEEAK